MRESAALVIVQFVETMTGIKAVQAYRREPRNQEIFEDIADRYKADNEQTFRLLAIFMPGVKLVGNITTGVVLLYGGYRVLHGQMTIGTFAAFLLYLRMFFEPMQEISQFFNTFQSASSALEKLAGVLAERPGIKDPERPGPARTGARRRRLPRRALLVCAGAAGAARPESLGSGGPDRRAGRHHRRGQDHDRQADRPVLRPDVGLGDAGWR